MTKQEIMKIARAKRDNEREALKSMDVSLDEYRAKRKRINDEYVATLEANKPTHHRLSSWQTADNAAFERWYKQQNHS